MTLFLWLIFIYFVSKLFNLTIMGNSFKVDHIIDEEADKLFSFLFYVGMIVWAIALIF